MLEIIQLVYIHYDIQVLFQLILQRDYVSGVVFCGTEKIIKVIAALKTAGKYVKDIYVKELRLGITLKV